MKEEIFLVAGVEEKLKARRIVEIPHESINVLSKPKEPAEFNIREPFDLPATIPMPDCRIDETMKDSSSMDSHLWVKERPCWSPDVEFAHPEFEIQEPPDVAASERQRGVLQVAHELSGLDKAIRAKRLPSQEIKEAALQFAHP